tara:strand:+ start:493 stop:633 length:141 start_codon:yes stop_codon:yes gene_type:complete
MTLLALGPTKMKLKVAFIANALIGPFEKLKNKINAHTAHKLSKSKS